MEDRRGMIVPGLTLGRYELVRLVGKGGGGAVYLARATEAGPAGAAGAEVALKIFHKELVSDESIFRRFQREAELGIRIRHPHIVRTYEVGEQDVDGAPVHYLAMEFVRGDTLRDTLAELKVLPEHLVYQVADQVLDALSAVHAEGMIHRDVKPENIILTSDQQVRLMDLGVARLQQEGRDLTRAGEFVGSLAYAAPEQFMDQDHVDPRADLYAVGVLLYEITTGVNPYEAAELSALIAQKLQRTVRRPKVANRDLDPFLDEVILTCLRIDPAERFATCDELRQVLGQGHESPWWKGRIEGDAYPAATRALARVRPPRDAPLTGRDAELAALHEAYEGARDGAGGVAVVTGAAGVGKSRLVHDFLEELVAPDGPFIWAGRCAADAGDETAALREAARGHLGEDGDPAALAPDVPWFADHVRGGAEAAGEVVLAYAGALRRLGSERPLVLLLEDIPRAGLFEALGRELAGAPVLLLATARVEGEEETPRPGRTVPLASLDRDACETLLAALVGVPRTVRALDWPLFAACDGNPSFLVETVAHLKGTGALTEGDGGWVAAQPIGEIALPANLRALLASRLEGLDDESVRLLEAAAVQGPEFEASLLAAATGQKRLRLLKRLAVLERKHRLLVSAGKSELRFAGRGLQRVIYDAIPEERRAELHARCADALREGDAPLDGVRSHACVRHLLAAGRFAEAADHVPSAADHAMTHRHAVETITFLQRVLAALPEDRHRLRFDVLIRVAAMHRALGRTHDQRASLQRAAEEAERAGDPALEARAVVAFARMSWRGGAHDRAEAEARAGLALATEANDRAVEAECRQMLGNVAYRRGTYARAAECWQEALAIRREIGDRRGEAATLIRLGSVMPEVGAGDRALDTKKEALEIVRGLGDRRGEGAALNNVGNALVDAERIPEALVCYEQAIRIARELGDLPAEAAALYNMARVFTIEARIDEAKDSYERALDIFREIGDPGGEADVLDELGAAVATFGDREEALTCLDSARDAAERIGEHALLARVLRNLAGVHHEAGAHERAWELYERALELARSRTRSAILADMGGAAQREGDHGRATRLLEESLAEAEGPGRRLLCLARLARALKGAGRGEEALRRVREAEEILAADTPVAPHLGPEIYYSLGTVLADEERGRGYLEKANQLLNARTRSIRSIVYRENYLTKQWPNREILEEARRLAAT